jgi:hypothetical protein
MVDMGVTVWAGAEDAQKGGELRMVKRKFRRGVGDGRSEPKARLSGR